MPQRRKDKTDKFISIFSPALLPVGKSE